MNNPKVDQVHNQEIRWNKEFKALRSILQSFPFTEDLKWGQACYSHKGKNIVLIHGFKEYCALLIFKGSLLTQNQELLIQQSKNVQAGRQLRFTSLVEIEAQKDRIVSVIQEAIDVEEQGLEVTFRSLEEYPVCSELAQAFEEDESFEFAFKALTPGRQRGYLLHFAQAKFPATRSARIERYRQSIMDGKGMMD